MKNNLTCELVEDLMPSYIDALTSDVTNKAIREHLAQCDKCKNKLDNMKEPCSEDKIEAEKKEIDFLKKNRRKNIRTKLLSLLAVVLVVAIAVCTLPYIESERLFESDIYYDLEVENDTFKLTMVPVSNEIVISEVIIEEFGSGEVGLDIQGKKKAPWVNKNRYVWEYTPENSESVKSLKIFDRILWEDGAYISDITSAVYATKHLYMGDMPSNGETANALGIRYSLGSYTNKLQSLKEPYEWHIILDYEILPKYVKEKKELMREYSYALMSVIDNLGAVIFEYEVFNSYGDNKECQLKITRQQASEFFGDDIGKCYNDINELQKLMEMTGLADMPYMQQNDRDFWDADINERSTVKLLNASDCEIKKIALYCRETETYTAHGYEDDSKFNIGKNPSIATIDADVWLSSLSSNLYDDERLGTVTFDITVYDWEDYTYEIKDTVEINAQYPGVYYAVLEGTFEDGFTVKTK